MRRTPFYNMHLEHKGTFCPWWGMEMPSHFGSILDEHRAINDGVGLFDLGYRSFFRMEGEGSAKLLDGILAQSVSMIAPGEVCQRLLVRPDGTVADWVMVTRETDKSWLLTFQDPESSQVADFIRAVSAGREYWLEDLSKQYAWAGISGARAHEFLLQSSPDSLELDIQRKTEVLMAGVAVHLWRISDDYFQFACQPELLEKIIRSWWALKEPPTLCGFSSYENWRLEKGELRYGQELVKDANPFELGLDEMLELDGENSMARNALIDLQARDLTHLLVYFTLDAMRIPRPQSPVFCGEEKVGVVCAGGFSPILNRPMGSAWIRTENVDFDELKVELHRQRHDLKIRKPPFK